VDGIRKPKRLLSPSLVGASIGDSVGREDPVIGLGREVVELSFGDHVLDLDRVNFGAAACSSPPNRDLLVYPVPNRERVVSKDGLLVSATSWCRTLWARLHGGRLIGT